jgi:hypothetical protein
MWSKFNNFTKKSFFGLFPASVAKIYLGNQALAYISGFWNPISQFDGLKMADNLRRGTLGDKIIVNSPSLGQLTEKQVFDLAKTNRAYGMGLFRMEVPQLDEETYLGSKMLQKQVVDRMWAAHNFSEDATRLGTFIETLKQGYDPFAGASATSKALYDYSDLGELDQMGKKLVPFYTFQRKNLENMSKQWIENPGKAGLPLKLQNEGDQDFQNQRKYWSTTKSEGTPLPVGGGQQWSLNSLWPANDVNRWLGTGRDTSEIFANTPKTIKNTVLSMINPFIRTPVEAAANYNTYSGQPINKIPGQRAAFGNVIMPNKLKYLLSQFRPVQDPTQLFTGTGQTPTQKALRYIAGINVHTPDIEHEKDISNLEDLLNFKGSHNLGEKNLPRYFAKEAQRKYNSGDLTGAKAAYQNEMLSFKQLLEDANKLKQNLGGK